MRRAVVVFIEDKPNLLLQCSCLYTSLKYIDPKDTDLVVYGTKDALQKLPDDCVKLEVEKASNPPEFKNYPRINSNYCFLNDDQANKLMEYDYILKTDADTFLTKAWNQYYPKNFTVGKGGYVNDQIVKDKLKEVAELHGLTHRGLYNIGSTHYGETRKVINIARLSVKISDYLLTKEFKNNIGKWPSWYGGVVNMYSNDIAVNHLQENVTIDKGNLDFESTSSNSVNNHAHIHCWHTDKVFSKFHYAAGKYDNLPSDTLNLDIIKDYCLYIALRAKKENRW
ncbi:DUF7164 domain-containing protein [Litchfieldia salsa]|uniref:DUF7164 domain-containing protein n=1 Tax=Litchfieldia salsa TaxID=930152 RepID=A0A1H0WXZ3_9BACI|nr:hypothetical protein [Litchfieldia salsa]SDP95618.1 hypothetical protein SAMN05216565_1192 [Litchfieldia salsa]